ncbi:MAG: hypothetical protein ABMA01_03335 [Chthoniobacteraceae bacterium]
MAPMRADEPKQLLRASPFLPFTVFLPSEKGFTVPHQDFASPTPKRKKLVEAVADKEAVDLLDVPMIAHIEDQKAPQAGAMKRRIQLIPTAGETNPAAAAALRERLSECVETGDDGRPRLTVTLPKAEALTAIADALARLMAK